MMNNKDFLDNIYKKYDNVDTSDKFYRTNVNNKKPKLQYTFIFLFLIVIASSILYGDNIIEQITNENVGNVNTESYNTIINYNIPEVDMNYKYCKGVGVKISNLYMDENNIYMIFDIKLNKSLIENINSIQIQNLIIVNEKNDIIYCENSETFDNFKDSNKSFNYQSTHSFNDMLTLKFDRRFIEKNQNHIKYLYILTPINKYPTSKNLYINFNNVNLYPKTNYNADNNIISKKCNWNFKINL